MTSATLDRPSTSLRCCRLSTTWPRTSTTETVRIVTGRSVGKSAGPCKVRAAGPGVTYCSPSCASAARVRAFRARKRAEKRRSGKRSVARRPDGGWRARYRDAAGKEHARHFARKVDAQRWLDEITAAVVTGSYVDPKAGRVTSRAYATQWRAASSHRRLPAGHRQRAEELHPPDVRDRARSLAAAVGRPGVRVGPGPAASANSVHNIYRVLAQVMGGRGRRPPHAGVACARVKLPSRPTVEVKPPTPARSLPWPRGRRSAARAGRAPGRDRAADLGGARACRSPTSTSCAGHCGSSASGTAARTGSSRRRRAAASAPCRWAGSWSTSWRRTWPRTARLRTGRSSPTTRPAADLRGVEAALAAAGTTFKTHDLRHYAASALIAGGASVKQVQMILATPAPRSRSASTRTSGRATTTAPGPSSTLLLRTVCGPRRWSADEPAGQSLKGPG